MEEIDISNHIKNFEEHLDVEGNLRIVVSGAFGSGKTYFLNKFFTDNTGYNLIKLFPVNYAVASNDDIFDLIKFDVLFELLGNPKISFDKEYFDSFLTSQVFIQQNAFDILKPLIEKIPKIGKPAVKATDVLINFSEKFEKFHKAVQVDDLQKVGDYIKKIKNAIASVEEDSITELIRVSVQSLADEKTKTVLLIDDLDRVDPEHIFRILNVFSSHFDMARDENKFFFDRIILVCDVDNIRNIFHNRYGSNIDFSGYIDKFYSRNIFRFDNNLKVREVIIKLISFIKLNSTSEDSLRAKSLSLQYSFFVSILKDLLSRHFINLRRLSNLRDVSFNSEYEIGTALADIRLTRIQYPIVLIIELLIEILGSKNMLVEAIDDLQNFTTDMDSQSYYFAGLIIPLLDIENNKKQKGKEFTFIDEASNVSFRYTIQANFDRNGCFADIHPILKSYDSEEKATFGQPNVLKLFYLLIKKLDRHRII